MALDWPKFILLPNRVTKMFDNPEEFSAHAKKAGNKAVELAKWYWSLVPPLHPAGWPFVAIFAIATILLALIWHGFLVIGIMLTLWCAFFFRNPTRFTPLRAGVVVAPADGTVSLIIKTTLPGELDAADDKIYTRVSIFLNVFNVHVQRTPIAGKILEVVYRPGKFFNATLDKASVDNERSTVLMETTTGEKIAFVQIAGLIARRIINTLIKDQVVATGELYGLIRFGSRLDIYLPEGVAPLVSIGQTTIGGETIIAQLESHAHQNNSVVL
jgi:phosphatidylserine decarboxylase